MREKGFTLIEMIVVLAVVAILAAILTPVIFRNIEEARVTRTTSEAKTIASGIVSFYKDVGIWPADKNANKRLEESTDYTILYTQEGTVPTTTYTEWTTGAPGGGADSFDNHLRTNAAGYATTGKRAWRGPYVTQLTEDQWGYKYYCNVLVGYYTTGNYTTMYVISAGSNRIIDTDTKASTPTSFMELQGDDIGFEVYAKKKGS
ncbi:MAG: prepilin-type N-terminal cleavage/methylation domain-containing protein [Acidobacteriota bacterium]